MAYACQVDVQRNPNESWGFRLQGGTDFRQELSVKKVTPNTPAARAGISQGDAIISINNYPTNTMTHQQASNLIRSSGCVLQLSLAKGMYRSIKPTGPVKFRPSTVAW